MFVGTLYPLALEALTGEKISVGAPFFNATFGPLFVPLLIAMPFGPLLAWKRGDLLGAAQRLVGAFAIAAGRHRGDFCRSTGGGPVLAPFGIGLALFVMAGALTDLVERTGCSACRSAIALARARRPAALGLGHRARAFRRSAITLLGIVCETNWGAERIAAMKPGETISLRGYDLTFDGLSRARRTELPRAGRAASRCARRRARSARCEPSQAQLPGARQRPPPRRRC